MEKAPETNTLKDGTVYWSHTFTRFEATVLVPKPDEKLHSDILNYGFIAPYLLVFAENKLDVDSARIFAEDAGLMKIAQDFASSVVFIYPTAQGGWKNAAPKKRQVDKENLDRKQIISQRLGGGRQNSR